MSNQKRVGKMVSIKPTWMEKRDVMDYLNVSSEWIEARACEGVLRVSIYEKKIFVETKSIEKMFKDNIILPDELRKNFGWKSGKAAKAN